MKLIDRPLGRGQRCAITERTQDERGFIHTNRVLAGWDQEVLISGSAAFELGRLVGMYPPDEVDSMKADLAAYAEKVSELEGLIAMYVAAKESERELSEAVA